MEPKVALGQAPLVQKRGRSRVHPSSHLRGMEDCRKRIVNMNSDARRKRAHVLLLERTNAADGNSSDAYGPVPRKRHLSISSVLAINPLRKSYVRPGFVRNGIGPDETCCSVKVDR